MPKIKKEIEHTDVLGVPIKLGSYVGAAHRNMMRVAKVIKITAKKIRVLEPNHRPNNEDGYLLYPNDTVVLDNEAALMYILRGCKK